MLMATGKEKQREIPKVKPMRWVIGSEMQMDFLKVRRLDWRTVRQTLMVIETVKPKVKQRAMLKLREIAMD